MITFFVPSSLDSRNNCAPKHIPSVGIFFSSIASSSDSFKPYSKIFLIPTSNEPTPGNIITSEFKISVF